MKINSEEWHFCIHTCGVCVCVCVCKLVVHGIRSSTKKQLVILVIIFSICREMRFRNKGAETFHLLALHDKRWFTIMLRSEIRARNIMTCDGASTNICQSLSASLSQFEHNKTFHFGSIALHNTGVLSLQNFALGTDGILSQSMFCKNRISLSGRKTLFIPPQPPSISSPTPFLSCSLHFTFATLVVRSLLRVFFDQLLWQQNLALRDVMFAKFCHCHDGNGRNRWGNQNTGHRFRFRRAIKSSLAPLVCNKINACLFLETAPSKWTKPHAQIFFRSYMQRCEIYFVHHRIFQCLLQKSSHLVPVISVSGEEGPATGDEAAEAAEAGADAVGPVKSP